MAEKSEKTKMIESTKVEDEGRFGIPAMVKGAMTAGAKAEDYIREKLGMKPAEAPSPVKKSGGGMLKDVDSEANPGLAKLPEGVRNKMGFKRSGGKVGYASGGKVSSASKRADGCAQRGKTRGKII